MGKKQMTDQQLALAAINEAQRISEEYLQPRPLNNERILHKLVEVFERRDLVLAVSRLRQRNSLWVLMAKRIPSIALAAFTATFLSIGMPTAQAKQQCSASMPSNPQRWWSYRLIDGRKCWYEGKPMLSKSSLEWPKQASAQLVLTDKSNDPLNSQVGASTDPDSFEARWRDRAGF
jgi:hypothetical protein